MYHWTWEGSNGTPGTDGTWWHDSLGRLDMMYTVGDPVQELLPSSGPGSAFPHHAGEYGLNALDGYIRTTGSEAFNRNSFTVELFFNVSSTSGNLRFFDISMGSTQSRGLVQNGILGAQLYNPVDGSFVSTHTNVLSDLVVQPNTDYYAAVVVSTGVDEADRYVDFYLRDLTNEGPLQYRREGIWSGFTELYHRDGGLSFRVGRDEVFSMIGGVRYSSGVVAKEFLMDTLPPPSVLGSGTQPLAHWTWKGANGTPGNSGTWWHDKLGSLGMWLYQNEPSRVTYGSSGPGAAFPEDFQEQGVAIPGGFLRTHVSELFNRNAFTVETFFHTKPVVASGTHQIWSIQHSRVQAQGTVRNGYLAARVYNPQGEFDSNFTNVMSNLPVAPNKDYYAVISVSTGPDEDDPKVHFYLQNLTDGGVLEFDPRDIDDSFTSLYKRKGGLSLRLDRDDALEVMGDVRYSAGVLAQEDFLISVEGETPILVDAWAYWNWEGYEVKDGYDEVVGNNWWRDRVGGLHMFNHQGTPVWVEYRDRPRGNDPGAKFPNEVKEYTISLPEGFIRTNTVTDFNRDHFTVAVYFNAKPDISEGTHRIWTIQHQNQQAQGIIRSEKLDEENWGPPKLGVRVFNPDGTFNPTETNISSSFTVLPGRDYYAAIGVSAGPDAPDRFVEFYLKDLSDANAKLQYERVPIADVFTSLYKRAGGMSLRLGPDPSFEVFGDLIYYADIREPIQLDVVPYFLGKDDVLDVRVHLGQVYPDGSNLRQDAAEFRLDLVQSGVTLESQWHPSSARGKRIVVPSHGVVEGPYEVIVDVFDSGGNLIAGQIADLYRPVPDWLYTEWGVSAFVPAPFEPVVVQGNHVSVVGRTYTFDSGAFMPSQMVATGEALFSAAPRLVAEVDGNPVSLQGSLVLEQSEPEFAHYRFEGFLGPIPVEAETRVEYDGFVIVDLALDSLGYTVTSLAVEFPMYSEHADLYTLHAFYGEDLRGPPFVSKPTIWDRPASGVTIDVPRAGKIGSGLEMSFNHAVWLGTPNRGFQWCAETAEHWAIADYSKSIEVLPGEEPGVTLFRLRVIDEPMRADRLEYKWGLIASPVRPFGLGGQDLYFGQSSRRWPMPHDFETKIDWETRAVDDYKAVGGQWFSVFSPWNRDFAFGQPFREGAGMGEREELNDWLHAEGMKTIWYTGWNGIHRNMTMYPYYGKAMERIPLRYDFFGHRECARAGYVEYQSGGVVWMIQNLGMDGVYFDMTSDVQPCMEPLHGCGFVDRKTGERIVTRDIFGRRDLFKRIHKIFNGEVLAEGLFYSHGAWAPLLGVLSFVDVNHNAENAGTDEYYDLDVYRAQFNPIQTGIPVEHAWRSNHPVDRNHAWGVALVHGNRKKMYPARVRTDNIATDYANTNSDNQSICGHMWIPSQWFDWESAWSWNPYYENGDVLTVQANQEVVASFHANNAGQVIFNALNNGESATTASFTLNTIQLGLPNTLYAYDVVTEEMFTITGGSFNLSILGKRPRVLLFSPVPFY